MNDQRELRFGTIALEKGFITKAQLIDALIAQVDDNIEKKRHRLIGTILFELGYITHREIDEVLDGLKTRPTS
ncbi:MAG: hypothetical protein JW882_22165 [Deltaproteobacteria bacterium]|nr:hypothetical protein [Deltaproteobacteria bacterium]